MQKRRAEKGEDAGALTFQTNDGKREFAPGDRIVFLENNRDLGVKNGMLGTVEAVEPHAIRVRLDGKVADEPRTVNVPMNDYQTVDHGYATTIHKNQGATVDRSFVLASGTMDRHLTYVAMTRHRDGVQLYAAALTLVYCGIVSFIILKLVNALVGLRVDEETESNGLDLAEHGETGYDY